MVFVQEQNDSVARKSYQKPRRHFALNICRSRVRECSDIHVAAVILKLPFSDDQPYIPPTKPYELSNLATDLVLLARYLLRPGGRLVFFLPTVTDEYQEVDIYSMMCEGMEVIANSLQDFGSWGRRVSLRS